MRAAAFAIALLLASCGSPPTHFFTLAPAPSSGPPTTTSCPDTKISVQHVLLPGILDREAIVRASSAESLDISGQDRWAAPLDSMIQRVVAQNLRQRLSAARILFPGDAPPAGGIEGLTLNIQRFIGDANGTVALQADWTLTRPSGAVLITHSVSLETKAASPNTPDVVKAMSHALGQLTDQIAPQLSDCPKKP